MWKWSKPFYPFEKSETVLDLSVLDQAIWFFQHLRPETFAWVSFYIFPLPVSLNNHPVATET